MVSLASPKNSTISLALCAICKNEENYIDEWIRYYIALGVDDIFIYQNNWRYDAKKSDYSGKLHLLQMDGEKKQLTAYNDFISNHWREYDFCMFFDVDEFLSLENFENVKDWLQGFQEFNAISVNWRIYGSNGLIEVEDGNYSMLSRFTKCANTLEKHVKQIVNLKKTKGKCRFLNPHFTNFDSISADKKNKTNGAFNQNAEYCGVQLNHYFTKTMQEWKENKLPRGRADIIVKKGKSYGIDIFRQRDLNEIENTVALDFAKRHGVIQ